MAIWDIALRLGIAMVAGGVIGTQREYKKGNSAGLRTHTLVALGACLAMILNEWLWYRFGPNSTDVARMAAYVISGIGFLGAGSIIKDGIRVRGLTTAAGLWVVACLGIAAGSGFYAATGIATALVFVTVWGLKLLEGKWFNKKSRAYTVVNMPNTSAKLAEVLNVLAQHKMKIKGIDLDDVDETQVAVTVESTLPSGVVSDLTEDLNGLSGVTVLSVHLTD